MPKHNAKAARNAEMWKAHMEDGKSFSELAKEYGVTPQRAQYIVARETARRENAPADEDTNE